VERVLSVSMRKVAAGVIFQEIGRPRWPTQAKIWRVIVDTGAGVGFVYRKK
jgi:hypothetical protein